ncbi:MAG: hypothetical protein NZ844_01525 [Chloroherpetonaceae bacterium]|nr:hypothetical protein [Chloroherpetonaceae bacterium]
MNAVSSLSRLCKPLLGVVICLLICSAVSAQERKYARKSITSLGSVLIKPGLATKPDLDIVQNRLKAYIELPRFDFNVLSENTMREFRQKANQTDLSPESIGAALNQTVVPKVLEVVKAVAALRAQGNLKEEDLARAAVDKMKGSGLTAEDIKKVYNSAFIYLPVITDYTEQTVADNFVVEVKGYILWYRIIVSDDGKNASAVLLTSLSQPKAGAWSHNPDEKVKLKRREVDGKTYARLKAIGGWAQAEALAMRELPEFKLSAEIRSVEGQFVTAGLGKREGINLDDGFNVVDFYDDGNGGVVAKEIGFYRAAQVVDNRNDDSQSSLFYGYIRAGVDRGSLLVERPRLPVDVRIRPRFTTLNIPRTAVPANEFTYNNLVAGRIGFGSIFALNENASSAAGIEAALLLNLARYTGITQFFGLLEGGLAIPLARGSDVFLTSWNVSLGAQKKFWFSWINLSLSALAGADFLSISGSNNNTGQLESLNLMMLGARLDASLELMLSPDLLFSVSLGYKLTTAPLVGSVKFRGSDEINLRTDEDRMRPFQDINFSGVVIGASISFTLPSSSAVDITSLLPTDIDY